jgi:hypothetical protein
MTKLLMVTFIALVVGTPLAYAGANGSNTERDGRHCTYVAKGMTSARIGTIAARTAIFYAA